MPVVKHLFIFFLTYNSC